MMASTVVLYPGSRYSRLYLGSRYSRYGGSVIRVPSCGNDGSFLCGSGCEGFLHTSGAMRLRGSLPLFSLSSPFT